MTELVPLKTNFVNCHAKSTWQFQLCLLRIIRPLHVGTKGQIQKLEAGQNKLSHLPIDESTLQLKKAVPQMYALIQVT